MYDLYGDEMMAPHLQHQNSHEIPHPYTSPVDGEDVQPILNTAGSCKRTIIPERKKTRKKPKIPQKINKTDQ
jgi:hypothetical protein